MFSISSRHIYIYVYSIFDMFWKGLENVVGGFGQVLDGSWRGLGQVWGVWFGFRGFVYIVTICLCKWMMFFCTGFDDAMRSELS